MVDKNVIENVKFEPREKEIEISGLNPIQSTKVDLTCLRCPKNPRFFKSQK